MSATTYQHSPDRLRAFLSANELTGSEAGALIDVNSRTMRRWTGGQSAMPYSAWYALHHIVTGQPPQA